MGERNSVSIALHPIIPSITKTRIIVRIHAGRQIGSIQTHSFNSCSFDYASGVHFYSVGKDTVLLSIERCDVSQVHVNSRRPFRLSVYVNAEVLLKPLPTFVEEMGIFCNTFSKEVTLPSAEETLQLVQRIWLKSTRTIPLTLQMRFDSIDVAR